LGAVHHVGDGMTFAHGECTGAILHLVPIQKS
jgi:hypothetical protein